MPQPVEITVRSQLSKIIKELDSIQKSFDSAENGMKKTAQQVDDGVTTTMRNTQTKIEQAGSLMGRVFRGLKDDIKALTSVGALAGGLKLSNTMRGSITDTIELSDTVRKLSGVFKIANKDQASFVGSLTSGLGQVGLGSDAAARALEGLSETQVRGQENLEAYAKTAGMLAGASNQKGQEGAVSGGLAGVLQAQGKNQNDTRAMAELAEQVSRTHEATGVSATDILTEMKDVFTSMNSDFKKINSNPKAMGSLIAAGKAGGAGSTDFLKSYLGMNKIERMKFDVLGAGKGLFNEKTGVNKEALGALIGKGKGFGMGNAEAGLESGFGMSAEQAKGLKLLYDNIDQVERAAKEASSSTHSLAQSFDDSKTMGEAFKGNMDRIKAVFAKPITAITGGVTDVLKSTQKSTLASAAVVGGSALLAAGLTKVGLGGVGSAIGIGNAQEKILEGKGEKIVKVHVTNPDDIGKGGLGGILEKLGGFSGVASMAAKAVPVAAAAYLGYEGGKALAETKLGSKISNKVASFLVDSWNTGGGTRQNDYAPAGPNQHALDLLARSKTKVKVEIDQRREFPRTNPASTGASNSGVSRSRSSP